MSGVDVFNIARQGVTLEELVPSQKMTDNQMDTTPIESYKEKVGEIFKIGNFLTISQLSIDTVASVVQTTGKGVMVWFYFDFPEWTDVPHVKNPSLTPYNAPGRHSVAVVDYTLYRGKKALIIEDSWGTSYGKAGQRVIDEDFFNARCYFAGYPMNFAFEDQAVKPKPVYRFTTPLEFGITHGDVIKLQDVLKYEGLFPTNTDSTGYYGAITAKAILAWQIKHKVAPLDELNSLQGRRVGAKTIEKLNALYGSN
jgi:hypothetical protein